MTHGIAVSPHALEHAARIWSGLTQVECAGLLYIALRYGHGQPSIHELIESMSMLPWLQLGRPLQEDLTRTFATLAERLS